MQHCETHTDSRDNAKSIETNIANPISNAIAIRTNCKDRVANLSRIGSSAMADALTNVVHSWNWIFDERNPKCFTASPPRSKNHSTVIVWQTCGAPIAWSMACLRACFADRSLTCSAACITACAYGLHAQIPALSAAQTACAPIRFFACSTTWTPACSATKARSMSPG